MRNKNRGCLFGGVFLSFQSCTRPRVFSSISALALFLCGRNRAYSSGQLISEGCQFPSEFHERLCYYGWMISKAMAEGRKWNGYLCYEAAGAVACMA